MIKKNFSNWWCRFYGSHLVDRLVEKKYKVVVIDNLSNGRKDNLSNSILRLNLLNRYTKYKKN